MVGQFAETAVQQVPGHFNQHGAHHDGGQRIQQGAFFAQEDGSADTQGCADGGKGVAPVVPGIGQHGGRIQAAGSRCRITIEDFFHQNGQQGCPEGQAPGHGKGLAVQGGEDFHQTGGDDPHGGTHQGDADEKGGQGLVFPMTVIVRGILRLGADAHENHYHDIGQEIGEGMHRIGNHGAASAQDAGGEFKGHQQQVPQGSDKRHPADLLFAVHRSASRSTGKERRMSARHCRSISATRTSSRERVHSARGEPSGSSSTVRPS